MLSTNPVRWRDRFTAGRASAARNAAQIRRCRSEGRSRRVSTTPGGAPPDSKALPDFLLHEEERPRTWASMMSKRNRREAGSRVELSKVGTLIISLLTSIRSGQRRCRISASYSRLPRRGAEAEPRCRWSDRLPRYPDQLAVCQMLPLMKMARSVVPPPISIIATPRSRSALVSTASLEASGPLKDGVVDPRSRCARCT